MPGFCQQKLHLWTQMQHEHYTAANMHGTSSVQSPLSCVLSCADLQVL